MKIINKTKDTIVAEEVTVADTLLKRMKGLMGKREFREGQALILKPCNSIHTFFMRFSIDVLFVDKHNKIIDTIISLRPFRITRINFNASFIVELPPKTIQSALISEGDTLSLEY